MATKFTVGPSAGFVKTLADAERALASGASIIVLGSYTLKERKGNEGPRLYVGPGDHPLILNGSLNSYGMPNLGIESLRSWLPDFVKRANDKGVKVRVSVAAFSVDEYLACVRILSEFYDGEIEFNFGCPNVWEGSKQHRIVSFDFDVMGQITALARAHLGEERMVIKLSPYSDPWMFAQAWSVVMHTGVIAIVTMNTFPNAVIYDAEGKPMVDVPNGYAGYAGDAIVPISSGQIAQFDKLRKAAQSVTTSRIVRLEGVGGVSSGAAAYQMRCSGADGVLSGTSYGQDPKVISRIYQEMPESLQNLAVAA